MVNVPAPFFVSPTLPASRLPIVSLPPPVVMLPAFAARVIVPLLME